MTTVTAEQIAQALNVSPRSVRRRAQVEGWKSRGQKCNGGIRKVYLISSLSLDIRRAVIAHIYNDGADSPMESALPVEINASLAYTLINKIQTAAPWNRKRAETRLAIVEAAKRFMGNVGAGLKPAPTGAVGAGFKPARKGKTARIALFVSRFNAVNPSLGIDPSVYDEISSISAPTLRRWIKAHEREGMAGLLDNESGRGKPTVKIDRELGSFIEAHIKKTPHIRASAMYENIMARFGGAGRDLPSKTTVWRWIETWKRDNAELYCLASSPDEWKNRYMVAHGDASAKAKHFLHYVEFDSTPADVMCSDGKRYTIVGAIDIFSRKARCVVSPTSKSTAIAALLRIIITDWGVLDVMIADNGQDYASNHTQACCHALGIQKPPLPKFGPEYKPHIERYFRTQAEGLFERLTGYIGHSVADRKKIESRKSFAQRMMTPGEVIELGVTAGELQDIIDRWIEDKYHQREHSSLGISPEARAAQSAKPVKRLTEPRLLDILLAPVGKRQVGKKGIRFNGGWYVALELALCVGKTVYLRQDPADASLLYVFAPTGEFICQARDTVLEGITPAEAREAKKLQSRNIKARARALDQLAKTIDDPVNDLLASAARKRGKITAIHQTEDFENLSTREAEKALEPPKPLETFTEADIGIPRSIRGMTKRWSGLRRSRPLISVTSGTNGSNARQRSELSPSERLAGWKDIAPLRSTTEFS